MTSWPNPTRPGYPPNPDEEGYHWLLPTNLAHHASIPHDGDNTTPFVCLWGKEEQQWINTISYTPASIAEYHDYIQAVAWPAGWEPTKPMQLSAAPQD